MIFRTKHLVNTFLYLIQGPKFYGDPPSSQSSTVTQATIPEELLPYIGTYMGAAEKQLYQKNDKGEVTGFQPYKAYGATFDEAGNQTGYDPAKGIAAWDPMQEQAYKSTQGLSTGDTFNAASNMAGASGAGSLAAGENFQNQMTDPNSVNAYMSPYLQNVMNQQIGAANRAYDITGAEQQGRATQVGAFGGSREALMAAENERARNTAIGGIQATGYQNAFTNAQQQQKNVADIGLQGLSQAGQAAGTMGNIGGQNLAAQTSILKTQADAGALARSREQTIKDTALLDYSNAMNKPMQDIGTMSNLVRGTPTNSSSATTYAPAPSALSQIGGLATIGIAAHGALKANGGVIEDRGYASGGIVGYSSGGSVEGSMRNKLEDLDTSHLQEIIKENESPEMTKLAKEVLAKNYAKGGIVAFADELNKPAGSLVTNGIAYGPQQVDELKKKQLAAQQAAPVDPMASLQASSDVAEKEAAIPVEERIQQQKALEEKFVGKDEDTAAYRKSIMDERANAPDEARRQMYMRLMEFGANWGSTPGEPLAAGLKAITSTLPSVMEDNKANKKMMRELNKAEFDLNHAARLEKQGQIDKATAQKEKASDTVMKYKDKLVDAGLKQQQLEQEATIAREKNISQEKQQGMHSESQLESARIAADARGSGGAYTMNQQENNLEDAYKRTSLEIAGMEDKGTDVDKSGKPTPEYTAALSELSGIKTRLNSAYKPPIAKGADTGGIKSISSDEEYNSLPSGTQFTGPDGKLRTKP